MSFGTELQSKPSHEALLGLQEFEIKLLEHMKKCIIQRIKIDKEYSSALSVLATNMVKFDSSEFNTPVYQVWQTIGKETENLSSLVKESADKVCVNSLDKLHQLISEKKMLKKIYQEERNRLDNECNKMNDDVNKLAQDYSKSLDKLQRLRWKHEELTSKGKIHPKQEDMKIKLLRQEIQTNLLHNEYIIALKEAILQDKQFNAVLLPALMQFQQSLQTSIVKHCRDILTEYVVLSDTTTSQFQEVYRNMLADVNTIDPIREYNGFISRFKSNPVKLRNYEFSVPTYLPSNEIVVGDLNRPSLEQRKADYSTSLDKCQHWLSCKTLELVEAKKSLSDPNNSENPSILSYLVQCRTVETLNREVIEQQCLEDRCLKMLSFLSETIRQNQRSNCTLASLAAYPELEDLDLTSLLQSNTSTNSSVSTDHIKLALSGIREAVLKMKPSKKHQPSFERSQCSPHVQLNTSSPRLFEGSKSQCSPHVQLNTSSPRLFEGSKDILSSSDLANNNNNSKPVLPPKPSHIQAVCPTSPDSEASELEGIKDLSREELDDISLLEVEDWYHGVLPREEVQKLLLEEGDFLVRVSKNKKSNETQYVLSVLWRGSHKHFIVQETEENEYKFEGTSYKTVQELIWHHFNNSEPITKRSEAILKRPVPREIWELRNDDIELREKIGSGQFGEVYKGYFKTTGQEVGVKTCRETMTEADKLKFLQEGRILKQYNHPNIVKFIGIAVHRHPVMIVMEYVSGGSLVTFLRQNGAQESSVSLLKMCKDVASGMAYLESKNCLHRDLAARNCLVGENGIVKISDFGMSREEREYIISGGLKQIPIKWTAPEALNFGVYTWACDVWSFGILVWEVFSEGGNPYPGMTNSEAKTKVDDGYRMSQPTKCPPQLYELVLSCWNKEPKNRPHFQDIYNCLVELEKHI